ncbi:HAMP domain-containing sensor histidine kinase [Granulicella aggregans]|jgi:signal transduction histidine kinase|uniref:HAMP domain-containing sensor histidine kinase n=1 Tax=Granulicella aggregans TaxID=474949 RepID=UPI0021DFA6F7|nr:HAMP domain-containing sensor histidine kinase [Granulicella aggregans]
MTNEQEGTNVGRGVRTHILLVVAMAIVIAVVTGASLLLIRHRLRAEVAGDLSQDLNHSVITFQNLQAERIGALERENSLLAELPTLKALMTSGDDLTIQDGATEFWQLSGNDLFALIDPGGRVVAVYTKSRVPDAALRRGLQTLVASPDKHYLIHGPGLYVCSLRPLHFGSDDDGTLLGYVVSGISIERTVRQISQPTGAEATFLSGNEVVASTLSASDQASLSAEPMLLPGAQRESSTVMLGKTRFLADVEDLSAAATSPLRLVVLKSFEPAERSIHRIDRVVLSAGLLALLSGTALMIALSRLVTRPLEELSRSVVAFGVGDGEFEIPRYGTQEVRQLSTAFAGMREEIQQKNRALLESERLATIGRMASSVSHDLRHYLAAIYANSEFLASHRLSDQERAEIFADVRTAVNGTTDMIESLLIFSRTGASIKRSPELMTTLLERAVAVVRAHPDAERVSLTVRYGDPAETSILADGKQVERALCNLLLNACQATRPAEAALTVTLALEVRETEMIVSVIDNGEGVPEVIRDSLFDPFVSEGKQKGTGLGLTLAHCIANEHGGEVVLLSTRPGETVFQMILSRALRPWDEKIAQQANPQSGLIEHEKIRS